MSYYLFRRSFDKILSKNISNVSTENKYDKLILEFL